MFMRPKHTLASIVQTLITGLQDGTVVYKPTLKLFPDFDADVEKRFKGERSAPESLPRVLEQLAIVQSPFVHVVTSLEGFWEMVQQLRRANSGASKNDLAWYTQNLISEFEKSRISYLLRGPKPQGIDEIAKLAKVLEVGLDQHEEAVLGEVNIKLQLAIAELLRSTLQSISSMLHSELESIWKRDLKQFSLRDISVLENALGSATRSRYADLDARIELLRLALVSEQTAVIAQGLIDTVDRREPRRQAQ